MNDDFRLLMIHQGEGTLVAVSAHERNVVVAVDGEPIAGSYLTVVAIADPFRDGHAPDGRRLISAVLGTTFDDIRARQRGEWVSMMVRQGNADGASVIDRLGATYIGRSGIDDVYVLQLE